MAHKVNTVKEITYQAAGATTGLTDVTMVIYDETHSLDGTNFPDVTMTEIGNTGRYYGAFTPDVIGEWQVHIDSATAPGKLLKQVTVVTNDVNTVVSDVATVDGKIDGLNDITANDVTGGTTVSTAESNIRGGSETLETIKTAVDAIASIPMVG
jgi:hypothetical protein